MSLRFTTLAPIACLVASFAVGCTDVGDDNAVPIPDAASATDSTMQPGSQPDASSSASDSGSTGNDAESTLSEAGGDADATVPTEPDAGPDATGEDSSAPDAADTGTVDAGLGDTGAEDTGVADAGADSATIDAAPEAGGPNMCTAAHCAADSIQCDGVASGVCTPEAVIIVMKDIAHGRITGTQLNKSGDNRSCYECLAAAGCLDTRTNHGVECGDLTGTLTAGTSSGETLANACLDVISCILNSTFSPGQGFPDTTPPLAGTCADDANNGVANCFCGAANDDSTACNSAPATADNGACLAKEYAGFNTTSATSNSVILGEFTTTTLASGMANALFACAGANSTPACPQCF